jgi:hypothetical protein
MIPAGARGRFRTDFSRDRAAKPSSTPMTAFCEPRGSRAFTAA